MKNPLQKIFPEQSVMAPFWAVVFNIILVYVVFSVARIEFLLENFNYFRPSIENGTLPTVFLAGIKFDTPGIFYFNALYILLMLLPLHLKERAGWYKFCKWVFIILNGFALVMNVADSVYFSYTLKRTAWSMFGEFGNESNAGKVVGTELLRHWYLVVFDIVVVWGMWKLYVSPSMDIKRQNLTRYYILMVLGFAVAALTVIGGIRGGYLLNWYYYLIAIPIGYIGYRLLRTYKNNPRKKWGGCLCVVCAVVLVAVAPLHGLRNRTIRPIAISNINKYVTRPQEVALALNTPFTMIRSIGNVPFKDPHFYDNKIELEKIYSPVHTPLPNQEMKKKNLVVIIIESMAMEYVGEIGKRVVSDNSYRGYTPFLDSLIRQSTWWDYSFDNGQKSIDAMPSVLASIPMFVRPYIVTPQSVNKIKGIPALLGEEGYTTAFFHGARTGSMGFDAFAKSIGFQKYYGKEDYDRAKHGKDIDYDGYWGVWDEPFLQYYAQEMSTFHQPFMAALFTVSNHHPFNVPEKYEGKFPEGKMIIHKTVGYTDNALREFFETAKRQPWYDNTVFVITNDHTNMRGYDEFRSDIGNFYGPIIIFDPSGEIPAGRREGVAQQIDILPTMMNYLGYDKPYVAFGVDLFNTPAEQTWAVNYINDVYQYVRYGYVLQYNGERVTGFYEINDHKMQHNLVGTRPEQRKMERELKALIQQYMDRMLSNRLVAGE